MNDQDYIGRLYDAATAVVEAVRKQDDWTEPMEALMRAVDEYGHYDDIDDKVLK